MNLFEKDYQDIIKKLEGLNSVKADDKFHLRVQNVLIPSLPHTDLVFWPVLPLRLAIASILMFLIGGSGLVFAAERSNPGEILYPVKLASEKVQLALAKDETAKIILHLNDADKRVSEMKVSVERNNVLDLENLSINYSANVDSAIQELEKINSPKVSVEKSINSHLEDDTRELREFRSVAPTSAQSAIQKAIDKAIEGHGETEKAQPSGSPSVKSDSLQDIKATMTPVNQEQNNGKVNITETQQSDGKKTQENSSLPGSDANTKTQNENNLLKDSSEKGGD